MLNFKGFRPRKGQKIYFNIVEITTFKNDSVQKRRIRCNNPSAPRLCITVDFKDFDKCELIFGF